MRRSLGGKERKGNLTLRNFLNGDKKEEDKKELGRGFYGNGISLVLF